MIRVNAAEKSNIGSFLIQKLKAIRYGIQIEKIHIRR